MTPARPILALPMAAALLAAACGGSTTPAARTPVDERQARPVVLVSPVPVDDEAMGGGAVVLRTPAEPSSDAERAAPLLDGARALYRDLELEESLETVGEAQRLLERAPRTAADFDALHTALLYRAMDELALDNLHRAREALRAAAALRPDAQLDEGTVPPAVRTQYAEVRRLLVAEQPVGVTVTTEPAGAHLAVDGRDAGIAPATVRDSPARHFLRVEAPGYAPRVLAVDFGAAAHAPMHIELPRADRDTAAAQVADLDGDHLGSLSEDERHALARALGAPVLVTLRRDGDGWRATRLDLDAGESAASARASTAPEAARLALARSTDTAPDDATDDDGDTVWSSPWLWAGVGAAVVAAGVVTGVVLLTRDPGQRFVVDANP